MFFAFYSNTHPQQYFKGHQRLQNAAKAGTLERFREFMQDIGPGSITELMRKQIDKSMEEGAEALLFRALDDEDENVRQLGLNALEGWFRAFVSMCCDPWGALW